MNKTIIFPNLHITLHNVGQKISIGNFDIAFYGIIISLGMVLGVSAILFQAKKQNKSEDTYLDICIYTIVAAVVGARLYYVIFTWDYYKNHLVDIVMLRQGGLGIYGGILAGIGCLILMCKIKKEPFLQVADICIFGVVIGQILGRWGNFFNREAFGQYTDGLFAMMLPLDDVRSLSDITDEMMANLTQIDGVDFVSVHPTFLYESMLNLLLLLIMIAVAKFKCFDGQVFAIYITGYGIIRFFVEGLRTDQLRIWNTSIPISQVVAIGMIISGIIIFSMNIIKKKRTKI